jgi:SET domain-containing protein
VPASKPPPYVIRPSPTHGRGVFATRTIRKGARIVEYRGKRMPEDVADNRPATDANDPYHTLLFKLHDGTVLDASLGGNAARWINHGCDPNCEAIEYDKGRVFICARRTIRAGEELRYDYGLEYEGRMSKRAQRGFSCRCGARRCRGTMLSKAIAQSARQAANAGAKATTLSRGRRDVTSKRASGNR